jgi:hypothetical protein
MIVNKILHHPQPSGGQAGMIVVLARKPGVEIYSTFHQNFSLYVLLIFPGVNGVRRIIPRRITPL